MNNFYVYIYVDPRTNVPFYVGKGKELRYQHHLSNYRLAKNPNRGFVGRLKKLFAMGLQPDIKFLLKNISEQEALILETETILFLGRVQNKSGPLLNMTNGGEGVSGHRHNEKTRKLISERIRHQVRMPHTEKSKILMRKKAILRLKTVSMPSSLGRNLEQKTKIKISQTLKCKGIKPPNRKGIKMSDDQKMLISEKLKAYHAIKKQQKLSGL